MDDLKVIIDNWVQAKKTGNITIENSSENINITFTERVQSRSDEIYDKILTIWNAPGRFVQVNMVDGGVSNILIKQQYIMKK